MVAYITDKGIDPGKFEVIGKGETDPVAPNDTPEGRQQNRRIEVQLINLLIPAECTAHLGVRPRRARFPAGIVNSRP